MRGWMSEKYLGSTGTFPLSFLPFLLSSLSTSTFSGWMRSSRSAGSIHTPNTPSPTSCTPSLPPVGTLCPLLSSSWFRVLVFEFPGGLFPCAAHTPPSTPSNNSHSFASTSSLFISFYTETLSNGLFASVLLSSIPFSSPAFPWTLLPPPSPTQSSSSSGLISCGFYTFPLLSSFSINLSPIAIFSHTFSPPPISTSFCSQYCSPDPRKPSPLSPCRCTVFCLIFWTVWTDSMFKFVCPFFYSIFQCSRVWRVRSCSPIWGGWWPFWVRSFSARWCFGRVCVCRRMSSEIYYGFDRFRKPDCVSALCVCSSSVFLSCRPCSDSWGRPTAIF